MYVEDTGTGDGDIQVTVEGEEYIAEANYDLDGNGIDETAAVMTEDGFVAYTDEDADGAADIVRTIDSEGNVVSQARYEESRGHWVSEQPQQQLQQQPVADHPRGQAEAATMTVDTPQGDRQVGPPTEDTDNDGRPDTAIVRTGSGRMMVTDVDGNGTADQVVEVSDTGEVTVAHHTGGGHWAVVEEGRAGQEGGYVPNSVVSGTEDAAWEVEQEPPGCRPTGYWRAGDDQADSTWGSDPAWDSDSAWGSDSAWDRS